MASSSNGRDGDILAPNFHHGFLELQGKGAIDSHALREAYHQELPPLIGRVLHNAKVITGTPFTSTMEWVIEAIKPIVCIFDEAACARAYEVIRSPLSFWKIARKVLLGNFEQFDRMSSRPERQQARQLNLLESIAPAGYPQITLQRYLLARPVFAVGST
jgi:hypothetical protein